MNITDGLASIEYAIQRIAKQMKALRGIEAHMSTIAGGALPKHVKADMQALGELEAAGIDDEAFVAKLAAASALKDPLAAMMNMASLAAMLKAASDRIGARARKLDEREAAGCCDAEASTATALRKKLEASKQVVDARLAIVLARLFEVRLYTINAVLKFTGGVIDLWDNGSPELRTAALKSSAASALTSLVEWEKIATQGAFKVGSTSGKGKVKI